MGYLRRFDHPPLTSDLPPTPDILKRASACLKTAKGRSKANSEHKRPMAVSHADDERSDNPSISEILKPGQNQPLHNGKDHCGRKTEHEGSVRCLQRPEQTPRGGQKQIPVAQCRVVDR